MVSVMGIGNSLNNDGLTREHKTIVEGYPSGKRQFQSSPWTDKLRTIYGYRIDIQTDKQTVDAHREGSQHSLLYVIGV